MMDESRFKKKQAIHRRTRVMPSFSFLCPVDKAAMLSLSMLPVNVAAGFFGNCILTGPVAVSEEFERYHYQISTSPHVLYCVRNCSHSLTHDFSSHYFNSGNDDCARLGTVLGSCPRTTAQEAFSYHFTHVNFISANVVPKTHVYYTNDSSAR